MIISRCGLLNVFLFLKMFRFSLKNWTMSIYLLNKETIQEMIVNRYDWVLLFNLNRFFSSWNEQLRFFLAFCKYYSNSYNTHFWLLQMLRPLLTFEATGVEVFEIFRGLHRRPYTEKEVEFWSTSIKIAWILEIFPPAQSLPAWAGSMFHRNTAF